MVELIDLDAPGRDVLVPADVAVDAEREGGVDPFEVVDADVPAVERPAEAHLFDASDLVGSKAAKDAARVLAKRVHVLRQDAEVALRRQVQNARNARDIPHRVDQQLRRSGGVDAVFESEVAAKHDNQGIRPQFR